MEYTTKSEALGSRGFLYTNRASSTTINVLVRVSYTVNDNIFSPTKTSYVANIGLEEGIINLGWSPGHDILDLSPNRRQRFDRCA
jgi:hypothetical protein